MEDFFEKVHKWRLLPWNTEKEVRFSLNVRLIYQEY